MAAVDKKIEAETANVDACVSRIQILRQRLRSAEIAVLEARKADFIARIQKLLPRRQQSARKIKLGLELVARGRLELRTTEAELFSGPGWLSTERPLAQLFSRDPCRVPRVRNQQDRSPGFRRRGCNRKIKRRSYRYPAEGQVAEPAIR